MLLPQSMQHLPFVTVKANVFESGMKKKLYIWKQYYHIILQACCKVFIMMLIIMVFIIYSWADLRAKFIQFNFGLVIVWFNFNIMNLVELLTCLLQSKQIQGIKRFFLWVFLYQTLFHLNPSISFSLSLYFILFACWFIHLLCLLMLLAGCLPFKQHPSICLAIACSYFARNYNISSQTWPKAFATMMDFNSENNIVYST